MSCKGLLAGNANGLSDPYIEVKLGGKTVHQTMKIEKTLNPVYSNRTKSKCWLECTESELIEARGLLFKINSYNLVGKDDELGKVQIPMNKIPFSRSNPIEYKINPPENRKEEKCAGILTLWCYQSSCRNMITGEKIPACSAGSSMQTNLSLIYSEHHPQQISDVSIDKLLCEPSKVERNKSIDNILVETIEGTTCIDMTLTSVDYCTQTTTTTMIDDVATTENHYEHQLYLQKIANNINPKDELAFFIEIVSFRNLITVEKTSSSDLIVEIKLGNKIMHQTKKISQTSVIREKAEIYDTKALIKCTAEELFQSGGLKFYIMIYRQRSSLLSSADPVALGEVTVPAELLCNNMKSNIVEYTIRLPKDQSTEDHAGFISLICQRILDDKPKKDDNKMSSPSLRSQSSLVEVLDEKQISAGETRAEKSCIAVKRCSYVDDIVNPNNRIIVVAKELQGGENKEKDLIHDDETKLIKSDLYFDRENCSKCAYYNHNSNDEDSSIDEYNHNSTSEDSSIGDCKYDLNDGGSSLTIDYSSESMETEETPSSGDLAQTSSLEDENSSAQYHDPWSPSSRVPCYINMPIKINDQQIKNKKRKQKANLVAHTKVSLGAEITNEYQGQLSTNKGKRAEAEIHSKDIQDTHLYDEANPYNESSLRASNIKMTIEKNLGKDHGRKGKNILKQTMSSFSSSEAQEKSFEKNNPVDIAHLVVEELTDTVEEDQHKEEIGAMRDKQQIATEAKIGPHNPNASNFVEARYVEEKCNFKIEPFPLWLLPTTTDKHINIPKKAIIHGKCTYKIFQDTIQQNEQISWVEFHDLNLLHSIDDYQLASALLNNSNIEKLSFIDMMLTLSSKDYIDYPPILDALSSMQNLKELEIFMKHKDGTLPSNFFEDLFESSGIESLVLWNVALMPIHMGHLVTALQKNRTLENFEIWCSEALGGSRSFANLAQQILKNNKKLKAIVLSHIGLDADDCEIIENALQENYTLDKVALLNLPLPVAESLMEKDHNNLQQFVTSTVELSNDGCLALREKLYAECFTPPRRKKKCIACMYLDNYLF